MIDATACTLVSVVYGESMRGNIDLAGMKPFNTDAQVSQMAALYGWAEKARRNDQHVFSVRTLCF